jgi:secondary thiamine-phosphate synthase enzyme
MYKLDVNSDRQVEFIDITHRIQKIVSKENVKEGVCHVYVPHTTAGITINENADPSVVQDITSALNRLIDSMPFKHVEGNSPGHVKSSLMGCSSNIIIEDGKLGLGTWQGIYFCEFDGPRSRKVYVKLVSCK